MVMTVKDDQTANRTRTFTQVIIDLGRHLMVDRNLRHDMQVFAVELRKLAYTMPAGHEDRLIHLSERMVARSRESMRIESRGA